MAQRITDRHPPVEDMVAQVSAADRDLLLRVYRHRLPRPDLEDCLQQATLELVLAARRGALPADATFIGGALQNKFKSRIIDVHRATAGRSPAAAANARSVSIDRLAETLPSSRNTAQQVIVADELRHITSLLSQLTADQRLVIANQTFARSTPREFCDQHGWGIEKYRKVAQRGRARLEKLLNNPELARETRRDTQTRQTTQSQPGDRAAPRDRDTGAHGDPDREPPDIVPPPAAGGRESRAAPARSRRSVTASLDGLPSRDPLTPFRRVLGEERSTRLNDLAEAAAPAAAARDRRQLLAERDRTAIAWDRLDRGGAYETRTLQRDHDIAAAHATDALCRASDYEQRAAGTGRRERDALERAAGVQRRIADRDLREVGGLERAEQRLHQAGRHLDDWMTSHTGDAATWLAAERELATRRLREITPQVELAATSPPNHVTDRIGDPPPPGAPQRPEWETLARRLERDRLESEAATADRSTNTPQPTEDRDTERRIRRLQRDQGHERPDLDPERDIGY